MRKFLTFAWMLAAATPVVAEGFSPRPDSCKLVYTAQHSDCEVENRYRCASSAGIFYRIEFFDDLGLDEIGEETSHYLPVSVTDASDDGISFTSIEGVHPKETLEVGASIQRLVGSVSIFGLKQPVEAKVNYEATRQTVQLAGKTFDTLTGNFVLKMPNSGLVMTGTNIVAYNSEIDVMIEIQTEMGFGARKRNFVRELFLPGQPGFGDEKPRHGCMGLSGLEFDRIGGRA